MPERFGLPGDVPFPQCRRQFGFGGHARGFRRVGPREHPVVGLEQLAFALRRHALTPQDAQFLVARGDIGSIRDQGGEGTFGQGVGAFEIALAQPGVMRIEGVIVPRRVIGDPAAVMLVEGARQGTAQVVGRRDRDVFVHDATLAASNGTAVNALVQPTDSGAHDEHTSSHGKSRPARKALVSHGRDSAESLLTASVQRYRNE
ncbi:MAG: hypothetical protein EOO66_03680, partial [Methylobacterium sp.]